MTGKGWKFVWHNLLFQWATKTDQSVSVGYLQDWYSGDSHPPRCAWNPERIAWSASRAFMLQIIVQLTLMASTTARQLPVAGTPCLPLLSAHRQQALHSEQWPQKVFLANIAVRMHMEECSRVRGHLQIVIRMLTWNSAFDDARSVLSCI